MSRKQLDELLDTNFSASTAPVEKFTPPPQTDTSSTDFLPDGEVDREGAMAKADLSKLAKYATKLYNKLEDETQMEAWVQAKITKAADYIASVYHYLEYEMDFSNYGHKLDNAEMMNEDQKAELRSKLIEARTKIAELKKLQAQKLEEGKKSKPDFLDLDKDGDKKEPMKKASKEKKLDEISDETKKAYRGKHEELGKKMQDAAKAGDKAKVSKHLKGLSNSLKDSPKSKQQVQESMAANHLVHEISNELISKGISSEDITSSEDIAFYIKENRRTLLHWNALSEDEKDNLVDEIANAVYDSTSSDENEGMYESSKPSAGLSAKKKSATVKKAKAGGDIGKPGKNFKKVSDKAAKKYGSKEKGEKVAAAAMWKNIKKEDVQLNELSKETLKSYADKKGDQMFKDKKPASGKDLTNYRNAIEKMHKKDDAVVKEAVKKAKKDYDGDGKVESGKDEYLGSKDKAIKKAMGKKDCVKEAVKAQKDYDGDGKVESGKDEYLGSKDKAIKKAMGKKSQEGAEQVNESTDLNRLKEFLTRLNG
jgi:hypothetical protein